MCHYILRAYAPIYCKDRTQYILPNDFFIKNTKMGVVYNNHSKKLLLPENHIFGLVMGRIR